MTEIFSTIIKHRIILTSFVSLALTFLGYFSALCLRFDFNFSAFMNWPRFGIPVLLLMSYRYMAYMYWGLNRGYWRHVSTRDLTNLVKAHVTCSLLLAASFGLLRLSEFPRSVIFIEFLVSIVLLGGARFLVRLLTEQFIPSIMRVDKGRERRIVVLGGGDSGHLVIKNLLTQKRFNYNPVAVLDDSARLQSMTIHGVPLIGGLDDLQNFLSRTSDISAVVLAIPSLSSARKKTIQRHCDDAGVLFKQMQAFEDIACLDGIDDHTSLSIEALLEKDLNVEHEGEIADELRGKRVLVTGAGGSIGSELVKQLLSYDLDALILVDSCEYNLYRIIELGKEWLETEQEDTDGKLSPHLASVADRVRMQRIFEKERPQFVFHAAAYKHVPLLEQNCSEAFRNNVIGTRTVLEFAEKANVGRFVLVSTDKAVDPSSVMGCSKRLAEILIQEHGEANPDSRMQTAVVRFGNVINSAGSVIPRFKEQILRGGPITITDPRMERYFMSLREAVRLILTAGVLGEHGEIFVLDMGKPIKIVDVARKMIALYGRRDVRIVYTGIRPGEKLSEQLTSDLEKTTTTRYTKVRRIEKSKTASDSSRSVFLGDVERLRESFQTIGDTAVAEQMFSITIGWMKRKSLEENRVLSMEDENTIGRAG